MAHIPQIRIPATYMRGGTSKGVFFRLQDLPEAAQAPGAARDALLLRVIGSPDPYGKQIDGMGGATSSTSKTVIVSKSTRPGHDVDYLFGQVSIDKAFVDWSGNCGNLSAAVGPFAISGGLVDAARVPRDGVATVRIWQANIGKTIVAHVPITNGAVQETGDFELDGVTFPAAEVQLEFMDPAAEEDGAGRAMFPTGNLVDDLEVPGVGTLRATMINAGIPTIFVNAAAIGYTGTELQDAINGDPKALAKFETIRAHGALRMGLIDTSTSRHAPAHAEDRVRREAGRLRRIERQARECGRCRPAGARDVDGQAAPRDDGHGGGRDRHGGGDSGHAGEPRRRRRRTHRGALRPSVGHAARRRGGALRERRMDRDQGDHEPQRARADGRLGARAGRRVLSVVAAPLEGRANCDLPALPGGMPGEAGRLPVMGRPLRDAARRAIAIFHDVSIRKKIPVVDGWIIKISRSWKRFEFMRRICAAISVFRVSNDPDQCVLKLWAVNRVICDALPEISITNTAADAFAFD
jgi:probable AcnD-accessory protein PrpF